MRDAGVGQHAFDVTLHQSGHVAYGHGQYGQGPQHSLPLPVNRPQGVQEDAGKSGERCGLHSYGHECGHCGGRPFVDVGCPDVKWRRRNLETEADDEESHADQQKR